MYALIHDSRGRPLVSLDDTLRPAPLRLDELPGTDHYDQED